MTVSVCNSDWRQRTDVDNLPNYLNIPEDQIMSTHRSNNRLYKYKTYIIYGVNVLCIYEHSESPYIYEHVIMIINNITSYI